MSNRTRQQALDKHHRKCSSNGGDGSHENISKVEHAKHVAYHLLFRNMEARDIAAVLTRTWIDPEWELIAIKRRK